MKTRILTFIFCAVSLIAQPGAPVGGYGGALVGSATNPNGTACTVATAVALLFQSTIYTCQGGTYQVVSGGAGTTSATYCADATGSTTTYTCPAPSPTVASYTGLLVTFVPQATNSGAAPYTLNVAGLGAKTLKQSNGSSDLAASSLIGGQAYPFFYNNTNLVLVSPTTSTSLVDTANIVYTNQARTMAALLTIPGGDLFNGGANHQTVSPYTIATTDGNKLVDFNSASAFAVTLPNAASAGFGNGFFFLTFNRGAGAVTITPTTSTINGVATLVLNQTQGAFIQSDGTNYTAWSPGGGSAGALSALTAATIANTLANANNPQTWNWAQTTDAQDAFTFGESAAATGGTLTNALANQGLLHLSTASGSTATPLEIDQLGITATTGPPALQVETTWNNTSLVGEGILFNATNTNSAAATKVLDLRVGNTAQFTVDKAGNAVATTSLQTTATAPGCTAGTGGFLCMTEGTAPTNVASAAAMYFDSTSQEPMVKMNGSQLVQEAVASQPSPVSLTGQTAAISNGTALCSNAAGACSVAGLYRVTFYLTCSATGTGSIGPTVSYTDEVGSKSGQTVPISVAGSATLATTMALSATTQNATGTVSFWSTGAAQIGYGVTDSGTGTYSVRASVERIF